MSDWAKLPQPVKTVTSKASDVVRERQFLINDDAQAGDDAEDIDSWTVDNENSSVNFSKNRSGKALGL